MDNKRLPFNLLTILLISLCVSFQVFSQKIQLDVGKTYQTIHSFGASDCWSMAMVGKYYPESKKKQIAEWLFSREKDGLGNPKGIGLSMWRFNIGAGSTEQGKESKITSEWRRSESFYSSGKYDWTKQEGQRWFLEAAKQHNVPYTLGFLNSSPVQMTQNGLTFGSGKLGEWNFNKEKIEEWTSFITTVTNHFQFNYVSPFNEPQWDWGPNKSGVASQEGSSINNTDIAWASKLLAEKFQHTKTKAKIVIPEAGQLNYLFKQNTNRPNQDNQLVSFFSPNESTYLGNLSTVEKIISGHSYFTTSPERTLIDLRQQLETQRSKANVDFWQSEYCILGDNAGEIKGNGVDLGMKTAMYVAKVIHADLVHANASSWSWWLAVSANDYKDGLIYIFNGENKGENDQNKFDADLYDSKTLWALGNYSQFIRPGMKRFEATIDQPKCLISGYKDQNSTILVLINSGDDFDLNISSLTSKQKIDSYTTSSTQNLTHQVAFTNQVRLSANSITTLVMEAK